MSKLGSFASSIGKGVSDTFTAIGSLASNITSIGSGWNILRGSWTSTGTAAQSLDSASSYPIASVNMPSYDQKVSASISSGTGVAFWISDAGSWWAAASYNNTYQYQYSAICYGTNCSISSYTCSGPCGYLVGGSADTNNCGPCYTTQTTLTCPFGGSLYYNTICVTAMSGSFPSQYYTPVSVSQQVQTSSSGCVGLCGNGSPGYDPYNCGPCTSCSTYSYSCTQTATGTAYYLKLIKSVGGVVSSITSDVSLNSQAAAILVETSGKNILVKAYSDTGKTNQIGATISLTADVDPVGASAGIIKIPSDVGQGSTISNFSATI